MPTLPRPNASAASHCSAALAFVSAALFHGTVDCSTSLPVAQPLYRYALRLGLRGTRGGPLVLEAFWPKPIRDQANQIAIMTTGIHQRSFGCRAKTANAAT